MDGHIFGKMTAKVPSDGSPKPSEQNQSARHWKYKLTKTQSLLSRDSQSRDCENTVTENIHMKSYGEDLN